jgi:GPH family glycoside/pentoside/hexuronide:cation symporter
MAQEQSMVEFTEDFKKPSHSTKTTIAFGFGALTDQMSHQMFQFLIFTYYYAIIHIDLTAIMITFIIFAIWDSINDPIIGSLSDRTTSKFGRRRFWTIISLVPFALVNILMFTPPAIWPGDGAWLQTQGANVAWMLLSIGLYDLFYTMFSISQTSLFSEMFKTEKERGRANKFKNVLTIVGLLIGFVIPTILIPTLAPTVTTTVEELAAIPGKYLNTGIMVAVFVIIFGLIFIKFGSKEDPKALTTPDQQPSIWQSLKTTAKNRTFMVFLIANLLNWFTFKMLTTIISLYGIHVVGITEGNFILTAMLLAAFLTAAAMFPVLQWLGNKIGMRTAFIVTEVIWILSLIPFWFFNENTAAIVPVIAMMFVGVGLAGVMYFVDIIIGRVIDEDEVKTGQRNQGAYYGINALINRYSTILVFVVISLVLSGFGWEQYIVGASTEDYADLAQGLKILMVVTNIVGIILVIFCLFYYDLHGKKWEEVQEKLIIRRSQIQLPPEQ